MGKDFSPEERLLNLIKGEDKTTTSPHEQRSEPRRPSRKRIQKQKRASETYAIKVTVGGINKVLSGLLVLLAVYLVVDYIMGQIHSPLAKLDIMNMDALQSDHVKAVIPEAEKQNPLSYYTREMDKRDIFRGKEEPSAPSTAPRVSKKGVKDMVKNLTLTGIYNVGDERQAVIKDRKTNQSYFLKEGESLGELYIEEIQRGKVVIRYQDETIALGWK